MEADQSWLQASEWLFPLRGRWLRYLLWPLMLLFCLAYIRVSDFAPRLASLTDTRVRLTSRWRLRDEYGSFERRSVAATMWFGPVRFDGRYPTRGYGHRSAEGALGMLFTLGLWGLPFLAARVVQARRFWSFVGGWTFVQVILLFPFGVACGPLGCHGISLGDTLARVVFGF